MTHASQDHSSPGQGESRSQKRDQQPEQRRRSGPPACGVEITGLGHYYPRRLVRREEIVPLLETSMNAVDKAILGDVDVESCHWASDEETEVYMAAEAARRALADAGAKAAEVDLLVLSNWSARQFIPELAPQVASALGADKALAFNLCAACAGFVHGVQTASLYLQRSEWRRALAIGCDRFSRRVRPRSRGMLVAGDAAGAVVLERTGNTAAGLIDSLLLSDGARAELVTASKPEGWIRSRKDLVPIAVACNVEVVNRILARNGLSVHDVDWVVPHPGTSLLHQGIRERLELPADKFVVNFDKRGNTSSASIPVVLSELYHAGRFRRGELFVTPAVGAGWYYGALLFRL